MRLEANRHGKDVAFSIPIGTVLSSARAPDYALAGPNSSPLVGFVQAAESTIEKVIFDFHFLALLAIGSSLAAPRTVQLMSEKLPGEADKGIEAFDHTGKQYSSSEEMKQVALESCKKMKGNAPEKLVSGSDDFTMFWWEPSVGKHPKTRMTDHQQLVHRVYFSLDGQRVASASLDRSVKLWNGIIGKFVAAFSGHVGPVHQISWSADGRLLLSGSKDYPEVQLVFTEISLAYLKLFFEPLDNVRSAYFARYGDEDIVTQSTYGSLSDIWDIRMKKLKQDLPGHADEIFAVDWNPDGENVASGGKDKVLKLWMG
ncbi:notchless protein homolog [Eucalyptus grandis]|uniref:notchless protein homolog n=1 Tax=Eucalyptus grandis TaxID=71139 RepID=UPI00192EC0ED|nr:notchless protein homolog [Eucalyptus grandis]